VLQLEKSHEVVSRGENSGKNLLHSMRRGCTKTEFIFGATRNETSESDLAGSWSNLIFRRTDDEKTFD
jgi:hypothetical protein